jgi:hexulose-6-phosphate isomerase
MYQIGVMQGRLSPRDGDKIQSFPVSTWREEFPLAVEIGYQSLEWVLDYDTATVNPLLTSEGRMEIRELSRRCGLAVPAVCCDYFMEVPFLSNEQPVRLQALGMLAELIRVCPEVGVRQIELPLIGKSSVQEPEVMQQMAALLNDMGKFALSQGVELILESDLPPAGVASFLDLLQVDGALGVNYDLGNSAYWSFDAREEIETYGRRISNVHIKDCTPEDYSVPLGQGNVDFGLSFSLLRKQGYAGDFILQAARGEDDLALAREYFQFTMRWVQEVFS